MRWQGGESLPFHEAGFLTAQAVSRAHGRVPVISLGRYVTVPGVLYDIGMRGTELRHNLAMKLIEIKATNGETWKVMPRWRGKNVAVHAPVVDGMCARKDDQWVITHLQSGLHTGGYFQGSLKEALKSARLWDEAFSTVSESTASIWPLAIQWKRVISLGRAERPWRSLDQVREIMARKVAV